MLKTAPPVSILCFQQCLYLIPWVSLLAPVKQILNYSKKLQTEIWVRWESPSLVILSSHSSALRQKPLSPTTIDNVWENHHTSTPFRRATKALCPRSQERSCIKIILTTRLFIQHIFLACLSSHALRVAHVILCFSILSSQRLQIRVHLTDQHKFWGITLILGSSYPRNLVGLRCATSCKSNSSTADQHGSPPKLWGGLLWEKRMGPRSPRKLHGRVGIWTWAFQSQTLHYLLIKKARGWLRKT